LKFPCRKRWLYSVDARNLVYRDAAYVFYWSSGALALWQPMRRALDAEAAIVLSED
jgi:hypothetical protein